MEKQTRFLASTYIFAVSTFISAAASANPQDPAMEPRRTPHLIRVLGPATYLPVEMTKLANPKFVYVNLDLARADGYETNAKGLTPKGLKRLTDDVAYAVPAFKENANDYTTEKVFGQATGNGGIGLNDNLGDGRSMGIITGYRSKGGGRTGYVGPHADAYHSSGGLPLSDAVRESVWSNLLADELPFGAHRALTIFATGTLTTPNNEDFTARAVLIAEDPHRFGHSVINATAETLGGTYAAKDRARIAANMKTIVEALPKPAGVSLVGKTRAEIFRLSVLEAVDRQAIQHGYLWAHRLFHGATSPANASPDGRLLDFGTMISLKGYARVQVLDDDGASGETRVFKNDLFKDVRDSWVRTLPSDLLAALPSEAEMFERLDAKFHETQKLELVRNAGVIDDIFAELKTTREAQVLGAVLFKTAAFKNETVEHISEDRDSAHRDNGYNVEQILTSLAKADLNSLVSLDQSIAGLIGDSKLRSELIARYQKLFLLQRQLVSKAGVSSQAESKYREKAAVIRNKPMSALFRTDESNARLDRAVRTFEQTGDAPVIQDYVDSVISSSRREFRDAAPYTVVMAERRDPMTGLKTRLVFDAKLNRELVVTPIIKTQSGRKLEAPPASGSTTGRASLRPLTCNGLFSSH